MLAREDVVRAYRRYLDREPESEAVVEALLRELANTHELADHMRYSPEYRARHPEEESPLPLPPEELIERVAGTRDEGWFLQSGARALRSIEVILAVFGHVLDGFRVLDFGCGCGRLLRHLLEQEDLKLSGVDVDPEAIAWCSANMPAVDARVCEAAPGLPFEDGTFDLVSALSVFTHLPGHQQRPWLGELARVLRPGGLLVLSVRGEIPEEFASPDRRDRFGRGEVVVLGEANGGENVCAAFHPPGVLRRWAAAAGLELLERKSGGARGNPPQDLALLQRRTVPSK